MEAVLIEPIRFDAGSFDPTSGKPVFNVACVISDGAIALSPREPALREVHQAPVVQDDGGEFSVLGNFFLKALEDDFFNALREKIGVVGGEEIVETRLLCREIRKAIVEIEPKGAPNASDMALGFRDGIQTGAAVINSGEQLEVVEALDVCGTGGRVTGVSALFCDERAGLSAPLGAGVVISGKQ
jgi:hypothetical protein